MDDHVPELMGTKAAKQAEVRRHSLKRRSSMPPEVAKLMEAVE